MAITAFPGNVVVFGQAPKGSAVTGAQSYSDYNTTVAPSAFSQGAMILDPRTFYTYNPGNAYTYVTYGWLSAGGKVPVIDAVPTVISTNSIAQTQVPTSSTALTLTASNTNNATVGVSVVAPETGATVTGLIAIDGAGGGVTFGSDASMAVWDPTKSLSRCLSISVASTGRDDSGGTWTVAGRDVYGFKMTESVTGSSIGADVTTKKAFKYISGITPTGTIASTGVMVGVTDTYGLPLYASNGAYVMAYTNNALVVSSTNVISGQSLSSTATSTTADVRGTYASSTASNGAVRIVMFITPSVAATAASISGANAGQGIVGITQYSSV